jgi:predicted  nucleic acid-binding Zn-ribbon protein
VSVLEQLLSIQEHDTGLEQLRHRREHLPEQAELTGIAERESSVATRRSEIDVRHEELSRDQKRHEDEIASIEAKIAEVDRQLYGGTVSAPRELQALQDEIAALRRRADDLETELLEILTDREPVDDTIAALDAEAATLADQRADAESRLAAAQAAVDVEIAAEDDARRAAAESVPPERLAEYEALRSRLGGIAIARLVGTSCGACHLSLSAVDIDRIRKMSVDEPATCEECGRMLVH